MPDEVNNIKNRNSKMLRMHAFQYIQKYEMIYKMRDSQFYESTL